MTIGAALPGATAADALGSPPVVPGAPDAATADTDASASASDDGTHVAPGGEGGDGLYTALLADDLFRRALFTLHQSAMPGDIPNLLAVTGDSMRRARKPLTQLGIPLEDFPAATSVKCAAWMIHFCRTRTPVAGSEARRCVVGWSPGATCC